MTLPGLTAIATTITASVLDAARVEGLVGRLEALGPAARCLYQGKAEAELADVAPYLVAGNGAEPTGLVFPDLWGQSAGIHLVSKASPTELRAHLRHFLMVVTEDGKTLYFRFYDPRVLRVFLPTCAPEQLAELFGPIEAFVVEDENPERALRFTLVDGALHAETIDLTQDPARKPSLKIDWKGRRAS